MPSVRRIAAALLFCFLAVAVLGADAGKRIRLRNEAITTTEPDRGLARAQAVSAAPAESGLFLIQFEGTATDEQRAELRALGVELLRYVPDDAFIAEFGNVAPGRIRSLAYIRWVGAYRPEHKIQGALAASAARATVATNDLEITVMLSPQARGVALAQARLRMRTISRESRLRQGTVWQGRIASGQLNALAQSSAVLWIEPAPHFKLNDEIASGIVAGSAGPGVLYTESLGYNGSGVKVAVADSGLDSGVAGTMHPDLFGRTPTFLFYGPLTDAADEHSHGTHVAGIIAGNGATGELDEGGNLFGLGVAPGASIIAQRIFDDVGNYTLPNNDFETLTRDAKAAGADIGSNSWGDDTQGQYDLSAMEFDALVRDADVLTLGDQPYILEFSAGNAGPGSQTVGSPAVAKNVIATGASQNDRFNLPIEEFAIYADGQDAMADFSSRGPAADGRIKPDLVAPGSWIASLRSVYANDDFAWWPISQNYLYQGGTSQAGPHVSGAAAVFVQYWRATHSGATPSPALVKAALINSATDMEDGLTTGAVPNHDEGWGRVNLPALIGSTRNYDFTDQTTLLTNGGVFEKRVLIGSSSEPLKITLTYTDVPGLPSAAVALVNDLDLEVIAPTGEIFRGNRFADGESVPDAPLPDTINNVEGVHLYAPVPGEYLIRVRGTRVVEDARNDSETVVDQDFALVISGTFAAPGVGIVTFNRPVYRAPDQIKLTLVDYNLAGQPSATILLRSGTEPAGEIRTLLAKGSSGVFTGAVMTATGAAASDGVLQVAHGNLIEAVYADALPPASRVFSAQADLVAPVISGLHATNRFGQVTVLWDTDEEARGEVYYGTPTPNLALTNRTLEIAQEFGLPGLAVNQVVKYFAVAQDEAGNRRTNNNGGSFFTVTNTQSSAVLLVDSYPDYSGIGVATPPLAGYTDVLNQLGTSYTVFDATAGGLPSLAQLQSFRCVIWRVDEVAPPDSALVARIASYVANGGSLFVASMEAYARFAEGGLTGFFASTLQVQTVDENEPVTDVAGSPGDPVGAGINVTLDYTAYDELLVILEAFYGITDPSDWVVPTTNASPVMLADGQIVGVRAPKTGVDLPGRVVFLSFPLDTVPTGGGVGNNRAGLLQNALNFLAPAPGSSSVTLDRDVYSLPGLAIVEVEDADKSGQGSLGVTVRSPQHTNQLGVTLIETPRGGLFRGSVVFAPTNNGAGGVYVVNASNTVRVDYFDASASLTNSATATIETNAPGIANVFIEAGYLEAIVSWDTTEEADSLVQYGESPDAFPINFVAYDSRLTTGHELLLTGLKPDTRYYLRVTSRDRAGNATTDDNHGTNYTFVTLQPRTTPWSDGMETNNADWTVITSEESESGWTRGSPGGGESAHAGTNVWGSNLGSNGLSQMESYLISPGIFLNGGNKATLHFWHNYDFQPQGEFDFQLAALEIITNVATSPVLLHQFDEDVSAGWEEVEIDLTPYLGTVVYVVWYHFLFSFDVPPPPRMGWLVDDVSITTSTNVPGTLQVTNNLWQAVFALSGPSGRTAKGRWLAITNATPGQYVIQYGDVPYYIKPAPQTNTLVAGQTITFTGNYTFPDANANGLSDAWETNYFGSAAPGHLAGTDPDGDRMSDFAEFVAGTNPTNALSKLALVPPVPQPNGNVRVDWPSVVGRGYRLESSTNLATWTPVTGWIRATSSSMSQVLAPPAGGRAYYRVQVQP